MEHTNSLSFRLFMSQLSHLKDVQETEKTKISLVLRKSDNTPCILRVCKGRNLSSIYETLRKIRNQAAVVIYDYVYEDGNTYILEEYVEGRTVEEIIEHDGVFKEDCVASIIIEVCRALEELHGKTPPVVHNDINPSNIKIKDDGGVKLFDFDISRLYKKGQNQNTVLFGTEEYASPEHFGYGQSEPRTDIYCLGVTMHKMLTGQGLSSEHRITYNGKLKRIIMKCLEFDPKNRYESALVLRKDLERFLSRRKYLMHKIVALLAIPFLIAGIWLCVNFFTDNAFSDSSPSLNPDISSNNSTSPTHNHTGSTNSTQSNPGTSSNGSQSTPPDNSSDNNHSRENAFSLPRNETISNILVDGSADWYKFTTSNDISVYRIVGMPKVEKGSNGTPTYSNLYIAIYNSIGMKLDHFSLFYSDESGLIDLYLEPNTEYFIKVYGDDTELRAGGYEISLSEMICDAGTDQNSATELMLDEQHFASLDSTLSDWYMFRIIEEGQYSITIHNINVGCRIALDVEYSDGSFVSTTVTCANEDNRSRWFNAKAGIIYLEVSSYNKNPIANGKYLILIEKRES